MYSQSAQYYDEIYTSFKDYAAEVSKAHKIIQKYKKTQGRLLLDVACGTGAHAGLLRKQYQVEGLDLDPKMLSEAQRKYPNISFFQGDMTNFDLGHQYDVIVCLFSSIGYVKTNTRLRKAIKNMERHLLPGGVLLIEPWFTPKQWRTGYVSVTQVNRKNLHIVRMNRSGQRGRISLTEFQYLVGTPKGIEHLTEIHELGLFTHKEYMAAFKAAKLNVVHDPEGLDGRGLYIGSNEENHEQNRI